MKERFSDNPLLPKRLEQIINQSDITDEELRKLTRSRLVELLHDTTVAPGVLLGVCREVLDRLDGKAVQRALTGDTMGVLPSRLDAAIEKKRQLQGDGMIDVTPKDSV